MITHWATLVPSQKVPEASSLWQQSKKLMLFQRDIVASNDCGNLLVLWWLTYALCWLYDVIEPVIKLVTMFISYLVPYFCYKCQHFNILLIISLFNKFWFCSVCLRLLVFRNLSSKFNLKFSIVFLEGKHCDETSMLSS